MWGEEQKREAEELLLWKNGKKDVAPLAVRNGREKTVSQGMWEALRR